MGARGRGALAIAHGPFEVMERPEPVESLDAEAAAEWCKIVDSLPAKWFPVETLPLLEQYCRHIIRARQIAKQIDELGNGQVLTMDKKRAYKYLIGLEAQQSSSLASLATKLKMCRQSSYGGKKRTEALINNTTDPWNFRSEIENG